MVTDVRRSRTVNVGQAPKGFYYLETSCRSSLRAFSPGSLLLDQRICHVVLVDVGHVGHRLLPDPFRGDDLDLVEPDVRIEPLLFGFFPEFLDAAGGPAL